MSPVTRFPPSPTGVLHIGGARTALFNWAFARHHQGRFLLRFEDTDRARSSRESERAMLDALEWLGIDFDPAPGFAGIPRQSERSERYAQGLEPLLTSGAAYRCTCTAQEVDRMRAAARTAGGPQGGYDGTCRDRGIGPDPGVPFCVRLRVPEDGRTRWHDLIAGPSGADASQIADFVLARTDGTPIYHLAVVVDDHDMGVTHVIRGREHLNSTPRQLLLYQALGLEAPEFAHVPLLVEPGGKKLSKRHEAASVQSYRERGYPPEALLNFIARLGWGHGDLEIFDMKTFSELFTLDGVGKGPSQAHDDKLRATSQHYLKVLPAETLHAYVKPFLDAEADRPVEIDPHLSALLDLLRPRSETLNDMARGARFYLRDAVELDPKAAKKHLKPEIRGPLGELREALAASTEWSASALEPLLQGVADRHGLKLGELAQPTRVSIVGEPKSPGIFETLELLGRERSLARLDRVLAHIDTQP